MELQESEKIPRVDHAEANAVLDARRDQLLEPLFPDLLALLGPDAAEGLAGLLAEDGLTREGECLHLLGSHPEHVVPFTRAIPAPELRSIYGRPDRDREASGISRRWR